MGSDDSFTPSPERIRVYVERRHVDCQAAQEAVASKDFATLAAIGHRLKGNGTLYGFPEMSVLGARLEAYAEGSDSDGVRRELENLQAWLRVRPK